MIIGVVAEQQDQRVALVPEAVKQLAAHHEVIIEAGAGTPAYFADALYQEAGAKVLSRQEVLAKAQMVPSLNPLPAQDCAQLPENAILLSLFAPFAQAEVASQLAEMPNKLSALSFDMIPRTTLAQSMDVLSSMASIAGYKAVLLAAAQLARYFPMLTTAAGSIPPAKVLILGAGVAGLQAIATAKRLGAKVEAFDTRTAVKEEVSSLGARFVEVEGAKDEKGAGGYAVEQTDEYRQKQAALIHDHASKADAIITTAQLRGKPAPTLIKAATVEAMRPGSVIVDLASSTGGNCELTEDNATVLKHGVNIIGNSNLAATVPMHASQLFSRNVLNLLKHFMQDNQPHYNEEDEIIKGATIVWQGQNKYQTA